MYRFNVIQFIIAMDEHMASIKKSEKVQHLGKIIGIFILSSMLIYGCMGYVGIGSGMLLKETLPFTPNVYESSKFWFLIGRILLGCLFALFILFVPTVIFRWLTGISFRKLMVMQLAVLFILLMERIVWFVLVMTAGLDWYVSPVSFGVIASYFTAKTWVVYFFGAISLFQIWVIWLQAKYMSGLLEDGKAIIWMSVIMIHLVEWCLVALLSFGGPYLIGGWFG